MMPRYPTAFGINIPLPAILFAIISTTIMISTASAVRQNYSSQSLFIALLADGNALVEYDVNITDPLAQETRIKLFGGDISNLIVVDYADNTIRFQIGSEPNEIILKSSGTSNVRISYTTPDFLYKDKRNWTFTLNSTIDFSVKLPPDSILTDPGINSPSIKIIGSQPLLTFKPGQIRFTYIIGTLGTPEEAKIAIDAAQTTFQEISNSHQGIVLTKSRDLLRNATDAYNGGRFSDASKLANQAGDAAIATGKNYETAQKAMSDARDHADIVGREHGDTTTASQLLQQANTEFTNGNYTGATDLANNAEATVGKKPIEQILSNYIIIIAVTLAAGGGTGAFIFLKKHKATEILQTSKEELQSSADSKNPFTTSDINIDQSSTAEIRPEEKDNNQGSQSERLFEDNRSAIPAVLSDSQMNKTILGGIVTKIIEEKPHLRPEDQQVLRFLAEKEGAAFESEIRSKFKLPKTTIWRLVKRLEREEIIEIRKAGGQNLIKLRFEDK
jgi:hypothetical protein